MDRISTVKDLIDFLQTMDPNQTLSADYIRMVGHTMVGVENRPLLKSLFVKENDGSYRIKPMFY